MSKRIKEMVVADIRSRIQGVRDILVVNSSKLDAVTDNRMRLALRKKNISTFTARNTLVRQALKSEGVGNLDHCLQGPSTLIWGSEDIVALSKEIAKWAKDVEPLQIKGGMSEGTPLSAAAVGKLSTSPGRLELIGQIVGLVLSPGARLAGALLGPGGTVSGQLKALSEKTDEGEAAA